VAVDEKGELAKCLSEKGDLLCVSTLDEDPGLGSALAQS